MLKLLVRPISTLEELEKREVELKRPFAVVLMLGCLAAVSSYQMFVKTSEAFPSELRGMVGLIGVMGSVFTAFAALVLWAIFAGIFHLLALALRGEGAYKKLLELVGYGYAPQLISALVGVVIALFIFPQLRLEVPIFASPEVVKSAVRQQILSQPAFQFSYVLGNLCFVWSMSLWVLAVRVEHKLSLPKATIAAGLPCLAYMLVTQYFALGF